MLNHALPHLAWIIHLAASVMWILKSEVKFEFDGCDNDSVDPDERLDVCISTGPILMLVELLLLVFLAGYFSFIYYRRGESAGGMSAPKPSTKGGKVGALKSLPVKHPNLSPQLIVKDGKTALKLYADAFNGAIEDNMEENGMLAYGEVKIGDSYLMVADEDKEWKSVCPTKLGNTSGEVLMMVPKCDTVYEKCIKLGFTGQLKPTDMPWGERYARLVCPFGHVFALNQKKDRTGYRLLNTLVTVNDGKKALTVYEKAFGVTRGDIMEEAGKIEHGEIKIGDSWIMLADEDKDMNTKGPKSLKNTTMEILLATDDTDGQYKKCCSAGFKSMKKPANMPWGDRYARVEDPFGHRWSISTKIEEPSVDMNMTGRDQSEVEMMGQPKGNTRR